MPIFGCGVFFTTKIRFISYACEDLVSRGNKAVVDIMETYINFKIIPCTYSLSYLMLKYSLLYCMGLKFRVLDKHLA